MPKTKKEAIPLKVVIFPWCFCFISAIYKSPWHGTIKSNVTFAPGACAKGLARSWPTCFHRRSSKRWWFLARFPHWWVNWVTCPKLQVFRKKTCEQWASVGVHVYIYMFVMCIYIYLYVDIHINIHTTLIHINPLFIKPIQIIFSSKHQTSKMLRDG